VRGEGSTGRMVLPFFVERDKRDDTMPHAAKRFRSNPAKRKWDATLQCRQYHRLYGLTEWKSLRNAHLSANPLCVLCQQEGKIKVATVVDHVLPHKGDTSQFFDSDNLQSLCKLHHDRKTRLEM
jgi:5-methylcytosine-specific restriction endonuclease McrA